ncbi:MAG: hypothetical protein HYX84_06155 [Chloroflexi bacterium]|nr:hypothetical protein [Chloroflexota bacterium]
MKARKLMMALLSAILLIVLVAAPVSADPKNEGTLTERNPRKNVVRDPLAGTAAAPDAKGWVVFPCESLAGFEYSISIKGLAPNTTYTLMAVAQEEIFAGFDDAGNPVFLPTSDFPARYDLGSITTNAGGEGELDNGLVPLPPGLYAWDIQAFDGDTQVLQSAIDPVFGPDFADFIVWPEWP